MSKRDKLLAYIETLAMNERVFRSLKRKAQKRLETLDA